MMGLLLGGVSATIVYIFKYDDWYPNDQSEDSNPRDEDRTSNGEAEGAY